MNAYKHAEISVKKRGGTIEDYYHIHSLMDSTKELCSDNRHRILHNLWGIRRVIIPIIGHTIINSDGKKVNVKDLCEEDHVLPDYRNKFIPTLHDFVDAITIEDSNTNLLVFFESIMKEYADDKEITNLLLSPFSLTGDIKSLFITHNSWFINEIIPKIFNRKITLKSQLPSPNQLFSAMDFKLWMDNGSAYPTSASKIEQLIKQTL